MSPFFEFYIDELTPLFTSNFNYILDFNFKCLETVLLFIPICSEIWVMDNSGFSLLEHKSTTKARSTALIVRLNLQPASYDRYWVSFPR